MDKWYHRLNFRVGITWQLLPDKYMNWRKWLFDPHFVLTKMGQKIEPFTYGRRLIPDGMKTADALDTYDEKSTDGGPNNWYWRTRFFSIHGAIRILGIDVGADFYFRKKTKPLTD